MVARFVLDIVVANECSYLGRLVTALLCAGLVVSCHVVIHGCTTRPIRSGLQAGRCNHAQLRSTQVEVS